MAIKHDYQLIKADPSISITQAAGDLARYRIDLATHIDNDEVVAMGMHLYKTYSHTLSYSRSMGLPGTMLMSAAKFSLKMIPPRLILRHPTDALHPFGFEDLNMRHFDETLRAQLKARVLLLGLFVGSIWAVFFLSEAMPFLHLNRHGVVPRTVSGLQGILFAPWLHAGLWHVMANTSGLLILSWLCMWPRIANFWQATFGAMLGAGLCAWLLGAPHSVHIGASGLVFGYAGYLIARGYYTRNILAIIVALGVVGSYGLSMLFGVLPLYPGVSWQSHIGGALGGVLAARAAAGARTKMLILSRVNR